ncbi:MAG TPA: hypothetical protein VHS57_08890 [Acidimicrobiales bacterium]|nr:hypothetical protein [Acidimicrobiales bacterium]
MAKTLLHWRQRDVHVQQFAAVEAPQVVEAVPMGEQTHIDKVVAEVAEGR